MPNRKPEKPYDLAITGGTVVLPGEVCADALCSAGDAVGAAPLDSPA